jgi:formate hydrogenlyase subunit 6/NADH:ubiquinone oxidoreductase subunit I
MLRLDEIGLEILGVAQWVGGWIWKRWMKCIQCRMCGCICIIAVNLLIALAVS